MLKKSKWGCFKPLAVYVTVIVLNATVCMSNSLAGGLEPLPVLHKAIEEVQSLHAGKELSFLAEKEYQVRKYYFQIQSKTQKLEILNEVKGHFEKAITKAEEKYDAGEEDVSQSAITKLKLGLAGTLNDIVELDSEIKIARLSLSDLFEGRYSEDANMNDLKIDPVDFKSSDYDVWVKESGLTSTGASISSDEKHKSTNDLALKISFFKSNESREKLKLARKNRKITRALLVSEVANYDFGIGDPGDLFEALIIYTRVLSGYYESVYNFNLAVADLNRVKASWIGKP